MSVKELAEQQYETLLYSRAVRLLRCAPDAWDLVQDTFEHALRGYDSFQPGSNMRVWLMTIMQHLFIDRCRRKAREPWLEPIDEEIVDGAMSEPDRRLRSLDAIHLATARILAPELDALVTYDDRLVKAATDAGLATISPGIDMA